MSNTKQPRTPAGSPDGGQFAATAGAEATTVLVARPEPSPCVLCVDCALIQENENPDPNFTNNSSCEQCHEDGVECVHDGHADDDFSTQECARCGTTLAGTRVHYAYWPDTDEAPLPRDLVPAEPDSNAADTVVSQLRGLTQLQQERMAATFAGPRIGTSRERRTARQALASAATSAGWPTTSRTATIPDALAEAMIRAGNAANDQGITATGVVLATQYAAMAAAGRHLVGQHGYDQRHHDVLMQPWLAKDADGPNTTE